MNLFFILFVKDVQQKVKPYILAIDMSSFKYDDFLRVLNTVNQYVHATFESYGICGDLPVFIKIVNDRTSVLW